VLVNYFMSLFCNWETHLNIMIILDSMWLNIKRKLLLIWVIWLNVGSIAQSVRQGLFGYQNYKSDPRYDYNCRVDNPSVGTFEMTMCPTNGRNLRNAQRHQSGPLVDFCRNWHISERSRNSPSSNDCSVIWAN